MMNLSKAQLLQRMETMHGNWTSKIGLLCILAAFFCCTPFLASAYVIDGTMNKQLFKRKQNRELFHAQEKVWVEKDYDEAMKYTNDILERNPKFVDAYVFRATLHQYAKNYSSAQEDIKTALKIDPDNPNAYKVRAAIHEELKEYGQAEENSDKAQENAEKLANKYYNEGNEFFNKKEYAEAILRYDLAVGNNPNLAEGYYGRAIGYFNLKQYDRSSENLEKAEQLGLDSSLTKALRNKLNALAPKTISPAPSN